MENKIIIFDFDGTLVDSFWYAISAFNNISQKYNLKKVSPEEIPCLRDLSSLELLKEWQISFWKMPFVIRSARKEFGRQIDSVEFFPEVENILMELKKRGYSLSLLTSNSQENIDYFLKKHNLAVFDFVYGGCGLFSKSRFMRKILKKYDHKNSEVFGVGDETRDIEAAKKSGIKAVAVSWGFNSREILEKYQPDYLLDNLSELLKCVSLK
ncbi:MAG: carotenoid oxygenase [Candidatus Moranbacteria bacterium CG23_combo_of_CG06-09_8_20_14_all_35_22]|nr:MAG: carotenoid oxygenase [Candidatus Moranbacteria bacterium CG23_combo_of_CG06-09_8_20_14_all_35_22]